MSCPFLRNAGLYFLLIFCCLALLEFPPFAVGTNFHQNLQVPLFMPYSLDLSLFRSANASSAAYKNIQFMRVKRSCWPNLANVQNNPALFNWPISLSEIGRILFLCSSIPVYKLDCARISQFLNLRHPHLS